MVWETCGIMVKLRHKESAPATAGSGPGAWHSENEVPKCKAMLAQPFAPSTVAGGVCVVDGYGVQVRVRNRCLIVSDGIGRFRRERSFAKALVGIKRLVIISHEGAITLEALRWLNDAGIAFLQIDRDGEVIAGSANYGLNDPRLRRALALRPDKYDRPRNSALCALRQARRSGNEFGAADIPGKCPRRINGRPDNGGKCRLTFRNCSWPNRAALPPIGEPGKTFLCALPEKTRNQFLSIGAFSGSAARQLPSSPRSAANPANAMLNYLYALLEAETRFACLACGLDPGLGVFHADQKCARLAGARPDGSGAAAGRRLSARPARRAHLQQQGLRRDAKRRLSRACAAHPHARGDDRHNGRRPSRRSSRMSPRCSPTNPHSRIEPADAADAVKPQCGPRRRAAQAKDVRAAPRRRRRAATCATCGGPLPNPERQFCDDCLPDERRQLNDKFVAASAAGLARMHAEGRNPMDSEQGTAQARRGERATTARGSRVGSNP